MSRDRLSDCRPFEPAWRSAAHFHSPDSGCEPAIDALDGPMAVLHRHFEFVMDLQLRTQQHAFQNLLFQNILMADYPFLHLVGLRSYSMGGIGQMQVIDSKNPGNR